jgi:hypothetical protein
MIEAPACLGLWSPNGLLTLIFHTMYIPCVQTSSQIAVEDTSSLSLAASSKRRLRHNPAVRRVFRPMLVDWCFRQPYIGVRAYSVLRVVCRAKNQRLVQGKRLWPTYSDNLDEQYARG